MRLILALLLFSTPLAAQSRTLLWASTAADLGTTLRSHPGYVEGNPILGRNPARIATTMIAMTAWTDFATKRLESQQKPNQAKWIRIAVVSVHVFCVAWNGRIRNAKV